MCVAEFFFFGGGGGEQAPKRDEQTKEKYAPILHELCSSELDPVEYPSVICKSLELFLDRVNVMRIDAANARLRLIAPTIKESGVEYEREKFDEKLTDGTLTLERTTNWINASVEKGLKCKVLTLEGLKSGAGSQYIKVPSFFVFVFYVNMN